MDQPILDKLHNHFSHSRKVTYRKGKLLILADQEPAGVSFLLDGIVEQYAITPEGNKVTVNVFKPPAFFPMSWAINRTPNTYFFAALTDVTVQLAGADETLAFLQNNPDVTFDLLSRVYRGTDALLKRLVLAASGIAASRLIFELLLEAHRFGAAMDDHKTLVTIKQSTLAARCGLARETVSRELHKLQTSSLATLTKQGIVLNVGELEKRLDVSF